MLSPMYANCGELKTFHQGFSKEPYVLMRYFFQAPPEPPGSPSFAPPIQFLPVATIVMPRKAFHDLIKKSNMFLAKQDEMNQGLGPIEGGPTDENDK